MNQDTIRHVFEKWIERLGLRWWNIDLCWYDDPGEIVRRFKSYDDTTVLACTYADWRYATGRIEINLPEWEELDPIKVEEAAVHELTHILVNEMREGELHHEERVVTTLTKAFLWVDGFAKVEVARQLEATNGNE